jgi:hypothetical protein
MSCRDFFWCFSAIILVCLCGCGEKEVTCFKQADPEIQLIWEEAVKLDKANQYMDSAETYDRLLHKTLTQEQEREVHLAIGSMYARMNRAAANGDPEAKKVVQTIEANKKAPLK